MTGTTLERGAQVAVACPACSPETTRVHEVIKPAARTTLRCLGCGHVHKVSIESPSTVAVRAVVSIEDESERVTVEVPVAETLAVGEEFVADVDGVPMGVRITSLEVSEGGRSEAAPAPEIKTIWTRAVDNVAVRATIHPADGRHEGTRSRTYFLPGDEELEIGAAIPHTNDDVRIEGLMIRDDAVGYPTRKLDRPSDSALAKDVKRIYARAGGGDAWRSPWS